MVIMVSTKQIGRFYGPATILMFLVIGTPTILFAAFFSATDFFKDAEPDWATAMGQWILAYKGPPAEIANTVGAAVPALLTSIALRPGQASLGKLQAAAYLTLLAVFLGSLLIVMFFDPANSAYSLYMQRGEEILPKLIAGADTSLKLSFAYGLFVLGLKAKVETVDDPQ
jgi:hypothetical protein